MKIEGKFVEVSVAAQKLDVSESTVRRLIRDDEEIIAIKIRGTYRIPEKSLTDYMLKIGMIAKKVSGSD